MNLQEIVNVVKANLPNSIKNNIIIALGKGIGKLGIATLDIPTAYLEGKSKILRATTDAKVDQINAASRAAANLFQSDNDLAQRALNYLAGDIVQSQSNRENVAAKTVQMLNEENFETDAGNIIDDDWLTQFWNLAGTKSNEEVQEILAKILAKEITQPKTISPNTLMLLSVLTSDTGKILQKVSNITIDDGDSCFVAVPDRTSFVNYPLLDSFGIALSDLFELEAMRLIRSAQTTQIRFSTNHNSYTPINYAGMNAEMNNYGATIHMLFFTTCGRELRNLIQLTENKAFTGAMQERYKDVFRLKS